MRTKLMRIVSCLVVICLTLAILTGLTSLTESKSSVEKYKQFFQQDADFDVLFLGSSKVINGVLPMELWNDYGIVSYNMGGHATTIPTSYWILRNALDYTTPKCVVIDCFGSGGNGGLNDNFYYAHLSFDAFPLSLTKIQSVFDLIPATTKEDAQAKRLELLWNFSTYHSRWSQLALNDYQPYFNYQKGAESRPHVSIPNEMAVVSPESKNTLENRSMQYLIKTIELCKEQGIDVLLVNLPYPANEEDLIAANTVADVAEIYDVGYVNFFNMDVVDYQTDMHDPDSHLNPSGALKITDYLGQILSEQYEIPDQRTNTEYETWKEDAEKYHQEKVALFKEVTSGWNYWMLLSDKDFSFVAALSEADWQQDAVLAALLRNAGVQPEKVTGRCIIAANRATGEVTYTQWEDFSQGPVETALGTLSMEEETVKLGDQVCWQAAECESDDMLFALLDQESTFFGNANFSANEIRNS